MMAAENGTLAGTATVHVSAKAEGRLIANFALQHYRAAKTFTAHAADVESKHSPPELAAFFEDIRSYASGAVLSAAAAMEAFINERFIEHGELRARIEDFERRFWEERDRRGIVWRSVLRKYNIALQTLNREELASDHPSFVAANRLIGLRNALVHFKPLWDAPRDDVNELISNLTGLFALSPYVEETSDFITMRCMTSACANWAVQTASALIVEFGRRATVNEKLLAAFDARDEVKAR